MTDTTTDTVTSELYDHIEDLNLRRVGLYTILVGLVGFFFLPIEAGLLTSFKTVESVTATQPYLPPGADGFTLQNWKIAFDTLSTGLVNSLLLAIPATVLSATLGSMAAYGLTQVDWRGQIPILLLFIAGVFIPYQAVLVPLSRFWSFYVPVEVWLEPLWLLPGLGSHHANIVELIITHTAYGIPICTVLFRSYYKNFSLEMFEAARLDGASLARIYRRIILPLSKPMFAVTFIYQFTGIWNDLLFALILVPGANSPAAPVTLSLIGLGTSLEGTNFGLRMAGAFVTALPTLVIYVVFGEQFAKGLAGET